MKKLYQQYLAFEGNSFEHWLLLTVSSGVVVLLVLAFCLALLALGLRFRYNRHERLWHDLDKLWGKDILNVLSGDMTPVTFMKRVKPSQELNFVRFLAPYGWRLRGSDLGVLKALALHYMPHVARQLQHKEAGVRIWAVNVISLFGMPEYEHDIFKMLDDKSPAVAMFAANALLAQKRVHYINPVLSHFHRFDKWNMQTLAGLLYSMGREAIPALKQIYLDPGHVTRTRVVAATALMHFADYTVADAAAALLTSNANPELVIGTLRLLREVGQIQHRATVLPLCSASDEVIRINAMHTLRALCIQEDRSLFLHALDDPSPWVARQAAWALKELGDFASLEKMILDGHPRAMLARQVLAEQH